MKAQKGLFTHPNQTSAGLPESECRLRLYADPEGGYIVVVGTRTVAKLSAETERLLRTYEGPLPDLKADF